jgi:plastocyanin
MKRVLVAAALGGLLLVGTPTLASSAQRNDTKAEKGDKAADNKGGDKGDRGDHKSGDRGDKGDRGDRRDHDGGRHGYRHGYYRDGYYGGGYWYGEPQECWYGPSGAYNCEPYGGDYYPGYSGGYYRDGSRNRNVIVQQHSFNPSEAFARPGQEVLWVFRDNEAHTVTADNKSFDSGKVNQGEFRLVFEQPGTYSYHCAVHPEMAGRVIVQG